MRHGSRQAWNALTDRSLAGIKSADPVYRPTNFWGPGLEQLLADMSTHGLEKFKSWPSARVWFYPTYGSGFSEAMIKELTEHSRTINSRTNPGFIFSALSGGYEARRDFDAACLAWNQDRWPMDLFGYGESEIGQRPQGFSVLEPGPLKYGRAYANYLLCLAALSNHVDKPQTSFLEIGGGYGVLGEIVMSRDQRARYVDLDIPPLLTVASYYLTELFGQTKVRVFNEDVPSSGPIELSSSAVLPNWRIDDVHGDFDVFVNSFSFQEMEPPVVDHYISAVCDKGVRYAVSLNSRNGKPKAASAGDWGALDPVRSADIVKMFERRGYSLLSQYDQPLIRGAAQLVILKRD
ncbi:putative sugar O-methyltransferase [Leekyejoonella antrihumi]|uniref:Putative sugar O-methyltransferase n=1 Tax=Leekyejoonella antrihumi TaxID=1660198 RepID=A0A563DY68_9MICO|nr:putative sugar O-methyltransferase [Leekyejoonella antrihumi]TWP35069.1 putative sugar O-methyltransferase [Leekyejoonella antrihumi]